MYGAEAPQPMEEHTPQPMAERTPLTSDSALAGGDVYGWAKAFAFVGTVSLVGVLIIFLQPILVPFTFALFLAYLVRPFSEFISANLCICCQRSLKPPVDKDRLPTAASADANIKRSSTTALRRLSVIADATVQHTLPRWVGVVLALLLSLGMIVMAIGAVSASVSSVVPLLPLYQARAIELWVELLYWARSVGLGDLNELQRLPTRMVQNTLSPLLAMTTAVMSDFLLVIVFLVFLLLEPPARKSSLRKKIDDSVSRYIILKSLVCFVIATCVYLVLLASAFPMALCIALLTFLLTYIPNLGPIVAICLPIPICMLDVHVTSSQAVLVVLLPLILHLLMGNFIEPHLFGRQFSMSPVVLLFSLGLWFILWGLAGAVLAIPLTSILRISCQTAASAESPPPPPRSST